MNPIKNQGAGAGTGGITAPGTAVTSTDRRAPAPRQLHIVHGRQEFAALSFGPESGPRVLALHGWLDNAASFSRIAPLLPDIHLVAVDFPGHGHSAHRHSGYYHFVDYALDVIAMADGLGWGRFHLLGHSLGAGVASLVAGAFPERIERLALIEGLGPLTSEPGELPGALHRAWEKSERLARREPPSYETFAAGVAARASGGAGISSAAATLLCERGLQERDGRWYWRNDARLTLPSPHRLTEPQALALVAAIEAETLLIVARAGLPFDRAAMQARVDRVRRLRVEHLEGGHHLHLEDAAGQVARLLGEHFS